MDSQIHKQSGIIRSADQHSAVIVNIAKVCLLIGVNPPEDEALMALVAHLSQHYGYLHPNEIATAFDYAIAKKYEVDLNHYGSFSALYVGRVMSAYMIWKRSQPKKTAEAPQLAETTESGKAQRNIDAVIRFFERFKEKPETFIPATVYDELYRMGIINPDEETREKYKQMALDEVKREKSAEREGEQNPHKRRALSSYLESLQPDNTKAQAKSLFVRDFFTDLIMDGKELKDLFQSIAA